MSGYEGGFSSAMLLLLLLVYCVRKIVLGKLLISFQRYLAHIELRLSAARQQHDVKPREVLVTLCQIPFDSHKDHCEIGPPEAGKEECKATWTEEEAGKGS